MSFCFAYPINIIFCAYRMSTSMLQDNRCAPWYALLENPAWLWEAVQRVLKATFEILCIWRLGDCLRL